MSPTRSTPKSSPLKRKPGLRSAPAARQTQGETDGKPTRIGFKVQPDGKKIRVAKRSGAEIDG